LNGVSEAGLAARIETIERGYEYLLAYAAQGRQDDAGTELRATLTSMHAALEGIDTPLRATFAQLQPDAGATVFLEAVERDARVARGAIGIVLTRRQVASLLVDNLNASVHLRALLTDLFLLEQAARAPAQSS
jgi:hypothetical protein